MKSKLTKQTQDNLWRASESIQKVQAKAFDIKLKQGAVNECKA